MDDVKRLALQGIVFDLDGTLVDSRLDFDAIRRDMGLPERTPILEAIERTPPGLERDSMLAVLRDHEIEGAARASLFDGVPEFLAWLDERDIPRAILTRNSRESTELVLDRLDLRFSLVLTREDAPPKPDPSGLISICRTWRIAPVNAVFCGDYVFDLEAGSRAGMWTVLFAPGELPAFAKQADHVLRSFREAPSLVQQQLFRKNRR